jgi:hypothetical protein
MAENEGLVLLRKISSRPPAASHLRFALSNFALSNFVLIPFRCRGCIDLALPNGGEGGIGFATQNLFETACGVPSPLRCVEPSGSHLILLTVILRLRLKWRRRRDWFCYAKSLRDRLRRPISASLRRTSFSSLSAVADVLIWLCQMAEKEGFEPPVPFLAQLISSQSHSATLPLLLKLR